MSEPKKKDGEPCWLFLGILACVMPVPFAFLLVVVVIVEGEW